MSVAEGVALTSKGGCHYLIWLPIECGLVLKARETWPRASLVFYSHEGTPWDESAGVVDEAQVLLCQRRGAAIDLVLDRTKRARSQFIFTNARGRPAVWWQTQQTARFANPGARVPRGRASGPFQVASPQARSTTRAISARTRKRWRHVVAGQRPGHCN